MDFRACINKDTLNDFARTNEKMLTGPIRGVVLEFPGLGGGSCMGGITEVGEYTAPYGLRCARENILLAYVFVGPWSYMNDVAVKTTDAVVDAIWERYQLPEDLPLIATGGSMGGCGALLYSRYAKKTPTACAVNCPGCDAPLMYTAPSCDRRKALFNALAHYPCDLEEALRSVSPIHQAEHMPRIPYYFVHTAMDNVLPAEKHSDVLVEKLRGMGHDVAYRVIPDRAYCDLPQKEWDDFVRRVIGKVLEQTKVKG